MVYEKHVVSALSGVKTIKMSFWYRVSVSNSVTEELSTKLILQTEEIRVVKSN